MALEIVDDFLADYEFARSRGGSCLASGELKLMFHVLYDAVLIYLRKRVGAEGYRSTVAEAEEWIAADDMSLMGFRSVCQVLGIEPVNFRAGLKTYRARCEAGAQVTHLERLNQPGIRRPLTANRYQHRDRRDRYVRMDRV